jgi:hypothetical protein
MNTHQQNEFLQWATEHGLETKDWSELSFSPDPYLDRFWKVPPEPKRQTVFLLCMLGLMSPWKTCFVWRSMAHWPAVPDYSNINSRVKHQILTGIGIPMGTSEIVEFSRSDTDRLITLLLTSTSFGCTEYDDLFLMPDNAQFVMKTSHHDVVEIAFGTEQALTQFVDGMQAKGYSLPYDLPDATFIMPEWMKTE